MSNILDNPKMWTTIWSNYYLKICARSKKSYTVLINIQTTISTRLHELNK